MERKLRLADKMIDFRTRVVLIENDFLSAEFVVRFDYFCRNFKLKGKGGGQIKTSLSKLPGF